MKKIDKTVTVTINQDKTLTVMIKLDGTVTGYDNLQHNRRLILALLSKTLFCI